MRIAVACTGLNVSSRFDAAECLTCYNVVKGVVCGCQTLPFPKVSQKDLLDLFREMSIDVLICGGIQMDWAAAFCSNDIEVVAGVEGSASKAAFDYVNDALSGVREICEDDDDEVKGCRV